jgi:predicted transposase/invertase (TIGR01784 family)
LNQNNNNRSNELTKKNKKYNLKNDIIFKAFFARSGNEIFLIDFLEALLKIKIEKIKIKEEVNLEQLSVEEKGGRLDLQATLNDGIIVNIELQMNNNFNIEERTTLYSSKVNSRDAKKGTDYSEINKVIMINILGYNLLDVEEYISETVIVLDKHRDYEVLKGIKWYFIELPKFRKKNTDMNDKIDQWICFIDDSNKEAVKMAEKNNVVLKKARKELNYLTGDAAVRRMAELREKWEMDEIAVKKNAERIGRKEGNVEGRMAEKKETARKLLLKNMKIEEIIEITGLTEEEIKEIKN